MLAPISLFSLDCVKRVLKQVGVLCAVCEEREREREKAERERECVCMCGSVFECLSERIRVCV